MTSVEKRKPFPQVCCEFLIPVKKLSQPKIRNIFKLVWVEMTWEQEFKHLARKNGPING
jgi:hypothetical protein